MEETLINGIKDYSKPLDEIDSLHFLISRIKNEKFVLLGESSHGTSEFYKIRAEISKRLIIEKGFTFIAVEGDWPACQNVNRYIKGMDFKDSNARDVLKMSFNRWPVWMWANEEMIDLIEWLKEYNQSKPKAKQVGFYGIDVYSLWESMEEILKYLEKTNAKELETAKKAFACFDPFNRQPEKYGVSASIYSEGCHDEVIKLLKEIRLLRQQSKDNQEKSLDLEVNAIITANAENYYRTMITDDNESWNIRDRHMGEIINKIAKFYGTKAKGIIWEHNTHVGDARATTMKQEGLINAGQVLREQNGNENVFIVGFGTHRGTVIAADRWGADLKQMIVPPAQAGSWEDLMHKAGPFNKLLVFNEENRKLFKPSIGHRAIGVVYEPIYEHYGNYVPSVMADRYDAFIFINHSNALKPLAVESIFV